jgi:signal transduction histidine kinase
MKTGIGLYGRLSRIRWLRSYSSKFLLIAIIGLHLPLMGIVAFITLTPSDNLLGITALLYALTFTGISTVLTIIIMRKLLDPIKLLKRSIEDFMSHNRLPDLPIEYNDEMGELMRAMQKALEHLRLLRDTKNDVIELISHDLRNPASSMLGLIAVLENIRSSDTELMDYCEKLKQQVNKQLALTNGILDSLKQEESLVGSRSENVFVAGMCESAVRIYAEEIKQKYLEIVMNVSPKLFISADHLHMQQVINNLVHNAIKFSYRGGKITINARLAKKKVTIEIADNGTGIEKITPDLLFKRFTKYSRPGTFGEPSSGLGLFICRKIVEKQGGSITATSEGSNKGSTFTISLRGSAMTLIPVIFPQVQ